jgi:hypothetical protein
MKSILKFSVCLAILTITFAGCGKDKSSDDDYSLKLSPPSWIQGSWSQDPDGQHEYLKFTSNDVIIGGLNFAQLYPRSGGAGGYSWSIKETKNTSSVYEITATASAGGQTAKATMGFRKVDNNTIEIGSSEDGEPVDYNETYYKIN